MYLKSIEVHGFKSFANKIKFQFHNGITGIVGPNGSGKSNVADAVRWVLGEQSVKQMRSSNMQDVIFSGTENRKPLGFAMVSITLDNSDHQLPVDYNEVTVTRRLYRSGESEYLLNGTPCRLRDIRELFYDTGIGKEGYSIIGQGQIDKILNGKPEERRELFDEAAGIVKYKRRKLTAQKKLDDENDNLVRINDILKELTRQLGPLERQSEKAKIYLKKRDELKLYDINMFLSENERIRAQIREVEGKIVISDHDIASLKEKLDQARSGYEQLDAELEALNEQIEKERTDLAGGRIVKQQLESQIALIREQIHSAELNDEHFRNRIRGLEESLALRGKEMAEQQEESAGLDKEYEEAKRLEDSQGRILQELNDKAQALESAIGAGQAQLIDILNARANTKAKIQRYEAIREQIQIRQSELSQKILISKSEQSQREEMLSGYRRESEEIREKLEMIEEDSRGIEKEIDEIQRTLITASKTLEEASAEFHREESRLESLRNITERYDGYGNAIRRVMEKKESEPGIHGVVADLLRTDKKYESAVETALGASIQNIVTDDENTAKRMIEYLKTNKFGRATFLPLSAIRRKGGLGNENALYEQGSIGVASTLVETDDRYEELIDYLLGKTLVVDHIDHAIAIAKKYKYNIRIVTLEGDLLSPGGSISGGAYKNSSNLLGRRREMESLEVHIRELQETMDHTQKQIGKLRDKRTEKRDELVRKTEEKQREYLNQNTIRLHMEELSSLNERTDADNQTLQNEAEEIEKQLAGIAEDMELISEELKTSQESEKETEDRVTGFQSELDGIRTELENTDRLYHEANLNTTALMQKKDFLLQNLERITGEIAGLTKEKDELTEGISRSEDDFREKQQQILEIQKTIGEASEKEQEAEARIEALQAQRKDKTESHRKFFDVREELSGQMSELDKERFRLDNQKERLGDYLERQINYLWEEYELTVSEAEQYRQEDLENASHMKKTIAQIKSEIKALGPVNVNAIEEYKEVHERHEFLSAQHADLVKAGDALRKVIDELDNGMRKQFREKFAVMQQEFGKAFRELFGGGTGTLELVTDEDILEAGIVITAQPPGKKLVNMMQMSGGEKALTAIALLFAIQNMKPSPFCLLDEIEAALDENNVSRYANYLHKLTKNTQFIIITHRRGTMASADRLYGITMQEKGVSTQVSVNMVEDELDA